MLQGKPLSYNNMLDLDAAWQAARSFQAPTVVIVKHLSPCGLASANDLAAAFPAALASDPVSAFGGVIAVNREFDEQIAGALQVVAQSQARGDFAPDGDIVTGHHFDLDALSTRMLDRLGRVLAGRVAERQQPQELPPASVRLRGHGQSGRQPDGSQTRYRPGDQGLGG